MHEWCGVAAGLFAANLQHTLSLHVNYCHRHLLLEQIYYPQCAKHVQKQSAKLQLLFVSCVPNVLETLAAAEVAACRCFTVVN